MDGTRMETAITPEMVRTAVGLLISRFGAREAEADRRGRARALLQSSRALAMALDQFAQRASPHMRGEHSSSDLHAEADAMVQALADWTCAVTTSAETHLLYRAAERSGFSQGAVQWPPMERESPSLEA